MEIYAVGYHSVVRKNKTRKLAGKWRAPENILA